MENDYYWSASQKVFLPAILIENYKASGSWPDDARLIDIYYWNMYGAENPPDGFERGVDAEGFPTWVIRRQTKEDLIASFRIKVTVAVSAASQNILMKYTVLNKPTPQRWIDYLEALNDLSNLQDLNPHDLPALPEAPDGQIFRS